jgi:hypothetical protein
MANEAQARACFVQARNFYKHGAKSNNKVYRPPAPYQKIMSRMQAVMAGNAMPRIHGYGYNALAAGNHLRHTQNTFGNCTEMSCVAASFVAQAMLGEQIGICSLSHPGDHTFVAVGDPGNIHGNTIEGLRTSFTPNLETYVIDVWCGVFCHVSDFYYEYIRKMRRWTDQNKFVMSPGLTGEQVPTVPFGLYAVRNARATINLFSASVGTV